MAANLDKAESSLTTVSDLAYLRGIDSSGNSVKISKADLASVLGVYFPSLASYTAGTDLNSCLGYFSWYEVMADTNWESTHFPKYSHGSLIVIGNKLQIFLGNAAGGVIYMRYKVGNDWQGWRAIQ